MTINSLKTVYTIAVVVLSQCLLACSGSLAQREDTVISESHSIYIEGGVLKVLLANQRKVLFIYVRPEVIGQWIIAGGEGGNQSSLWLHKMTMLWAPGDKDGWFAEDAPRKAFSAVFDGRNRTLTMDSGTYAVNEGGFIVIALDENWQPGKVKTGISSLRIFDIPEENRKHLLSEARKHFN